VRVDQPAFLWLLLLGLPLTWWAWRSLSVFTAGRRATTIGVRLVVLLVLVLLLAGLQTEQTHRDLTVVAVADASLSVQQFAKAPRVGEPPEPPQAPQAPHGNAALGADAKFHDWLRDWLRLVSDERRPDDRFAFVRFDGLPMVARSATTAVDFEGAMLVQNSDGTDVAAAIRTALAVFPTDSGKRMVLAWDGRDTQSGEGQIMAAAREARAMNVPIDVLPVPYEVQREVMIDGVYAPVEARRDQTVSVTVALAATHRAAGTLYLRHNGQRLDLTPDQPGDGLAISPDQWLGTDADELGRFVARRTIDVPISRQGVNRFEARFVADDGNDAVTVNNRLETFTLVRGTRRGLVVQNVEGDAGRLLADVLERDGIASDTVQGGEQLPFDPVDLQAYDAVIMHNVPAEQVSDAQQKALLRYVQDMGGGLIAVGGPDGFGAGNWDNTTLDQHLFAVRSRLPDRKMMPSGALVIVLDRSGSMSDLVTGTTQTKQMIANDAAVEAVRTLFRRDLLGVIAFDFGPRWIVPFGENDDPLRAINAIGQIVPEGGTDIYPALNQAYDALSRLDDREVAVKHVILLTDGESRPGNTRATIARFKDAGITLSTVGVGDEVNDVLLASLAGKTGGNYHKVTDPRKLPKIFIKEARSVRRSLIREVTFDPRVVGDGSRLVETLPKLPALDGLVVTSARQEPTVSTAIVGPEGEPLFAHWRVGLGQSAAFTSDATTRWSSAWVSGGAFAEFWQTVVRGIARPPAARGYDLRITREGRRIKVELDAAALDERGQSRQLINGLAVVGTLIDPRDETRTIRLPQTAPGRYETELPESGPGSYVVSLIAQQPDGQRRAVIGGWSAPPGVELRTFSSDTARVRQIAALTGGRVLDPASTDANLLFKRDRPFVSRSVRPLWLPLLVLLLALVIADVATRRFAVDVARAARRLWANLTRYRQSGQREQEVATSLGALRDRARSPTDHTQPAAAPTDPSPPKLSFAQRRQQQQRATTPPAPTSQRGTPPTSATAAGEPGDDRADTDTDTDTDDATTRRLLAARRRKQQEQRDA